MISEAIINLGIVAATCLLLIVYLTRFVLRYKHEYESNPLCTSTVIFCLLTVLLVTFILPIDIFLVSFVKSPDGIFKQWATNETLASIDEALFATYYSLYAITLFMILIILPFLHFLNEETESNSRDRMRTAVKFTLFFALISVAIFIFGAFMNKNNPDPNLIFNKIIHLAETTRFQSSINIMLTIVTMTGFLNVTFYTASGIFSWPIGLLLGTSSLTDRSATINEREMTLRMKISNLQEKTRVGRLSAREREELAEAENDLRDLEREEVMLSNYSDSWTFKLRCAIRPLQIVIGTLFGLLSILLVATLIIVNIDRILHGAGPKQGYILLKPTILNPLEYVYVKLQDLIFIGPMPLLIIVCFLVVAGISGMRNLGLWFLFARIHRIKVGRTHPQALLFFCMTTMLTALAYSMILYSMTPQFFTFGNQNFIETVNGTAIVKPCSLDNYNKDCILTRGSILIMRMMSQVWIFGAIFYWMSWTFIVVASLSLIGYLIRGRRGATHGITSNEDEFED